VGDETKSPQSAKTPVLAWGQFLLRRSILSGEEAQCVSLAFGTAFNNTEPRGAGEGTESVRAYGEVLGWSAAGFVNEPSDNFKEAAGSMCVTRSGSTEWFTAEPPVHLSAVVAKGINGAPTERLVIQGPFRGSATHREPPSLPWLEESEGTENTETRAKTFFVKIGIAAHPTERTQVETEEAAAGVPTERRTGCYPFPALTEIVREPGYVKGRETELQRRPSPPGCVKVTLVAPEEGLEVPYEGSLEPEEVNGVRNGLLPSSGVFKGGSAGIETEGGPLTEHSSERNERGLTSALGRGFAKSTSPIKEVGYIHEELLTLK
jgi:hypothetical protein